MNTLPSLSKSKSSQIKGIAIILMLLHHYILNTFIFHGHSNALNIEPWQLMLCTTGKLCIGLFVFISGYGLAKSPSDFAANIKRLAKFMIPYYLALALTVAGFAAFKILPPQITKAEWVLLLCAFSVAINGAWWYAGIYIEFLALACFTKNVLKDRIIFIVPLALLLYSFYPDSFLPYAHKALAKTDLFSFFYSGYWFSQLTQWQLIFFTAYAASKYSVPEKISVKLQNVPLWVKIPCASSAMALLLAARFALPFRWSSAAAPWDIPVTTFIAHGTALDFIIIPLLVLMMIIVLPEKNKVLDFFGRHSINLWLIHGLFVEILKMNHFLKSSLVILFTAVTAASVIYSLGAIRLSTKIYNAAAWLLQRKREQGQNAGR